MNRLFTVTFFFVIGVSPIHAQEPSPLGGLPPIPNLGEAGTKKDKGLFERIKDRQEANAEAQRKQRIVREDAVRKKKSKTGIDLIKRKQDPIPEGEEPARAQRAPGSVPGQVTAPPDAMTPSGSRLKPFGADDFWQDEILPPEENIIDLPAMPDLRTQDQKTRVERMKEARVAKFEARQEALVAKQEAKEKAAQVATIRQTPPDPSTALVQVNRQQALYSYNGAPVNPETPNGKKLKAFSQGSKYIQDNQLVYTGARPERPQTNWIRRGLNPGQFPGDGGSKFEWKNPFAPDSRGGTDYEVTPLEGASGLQGNIGEPVDDGTPLVSSLRAIRVVPGTRDVSKSGLGGLNGIIKDGVDLPERAENVLASYLGQSLTLGTLNKLVRETVVAYRESDLPVIDVLVPEQEVTSGVLQLVIIEGRLGDVIVEGASGSSGDLLANQVRLERGDVIRESVLLDDLNWMNKHPLRRVDLVYAPGADYGQTDIILRTNQLDPFSWYMGYEDSGNEVLGKERFLAGASLAGPLFFSEENILSYQFTTNLDGGSDLFGHSAIFASYLPWRHYFTLLGAYVESDATIEADGQTLRTGGLNQQLSARYAVPLPSLGKWTHEFELGMDFKSSNSDLAFNELQVFDTTSEIVQFSIGYNANMTQGNGLWRLDSEIVVSPGDMTSKATDEVYESQRALASSDYIYGRVLIERQQNLPKQWQLIGRVQGQASGTNLLPSETLGAGGYDSVRGFEQRIVRGDNGFVGTLELRTPSVSPSRLLGFYNAQDAMVFLAFLDYGTLVSSEKLPNEESVTLGSVGAGLRYQLDDNVTVRLDYGAQVIEEGFDDEEKGRLHIGARANF